MIFHSTGLEGSYLIEPARFTDERGSFARTWCAEEFAAHGLAQQFSQCSTSSNNREGTLRGLHFQLAPAAEAKLVRCVRGRIFDVIVDLRPCSPTCLGWFAAELDAASQRMIYVPEGFAHGFQTLEDDSEVFYQISAPYRAELARGVRWDDPALSIPWPATRQRIISARDSTLPTLGELLASNAAFRLSHRRVLACV
jgi:dTDP-4-dehydrorhamnose 3,5-epimerase